MCAAAVTPPAIMAAWIEDYALIAPAEHRKES
jgi:hypothetical protein